METGTPHPALNGLIGAYQGYDHVLDPAAVHFGLPSPGATLVVEFDAPLDIAWLSKRERTLLHCSVSGLHTSAVVVHTHGRQYGVHVNISPAGFRRLLGLPIATLTETTADLGDVLPGRGLHERLAALDDWPARYRLLDEVFLHALDRGRAMVPADLRAVQTLVGRARGGIGVSELAGHVGYSRRRLLARFRSEFGVGVKEYSRIVRFTYAHRMALTGRPLAQVAHLAGFADQAHLSREWRVFAGRTPRATLAEVFPLAEAGGV